MEANITFADDPKFVFGDRRAKVWLECEGEPRDFRSVDAIGIRTVVDEIGLVVLTCPRCGKRHQSLRLI